MHLLLTLSGLNLVAAVNVVSLIATDDGPPPTATASGDPEPVSDSPRVSCTINNDPGPGDLPRTPFSSGTLPITLSKAQATEFAEFEGTTTENAAIIATEGEKESTFTTDVIIGPGGFFWAAEPMSSLIWPAIPPQEPPPLPTADCYEFGDVYETSCSGGGEGAGGGTEAGPGNREGDEVPPGFATGDVPPNGSGEVTPTQTSDTGDSPPEPPGGSEAPPVGAAPSSAPDDGPSDGPSPETPSEEPDGTTPGSKTPGSNGPENTAPPADAPTNDPNTGKDPEQPDNGTPAAGQPGPGQTMPNQPPPDGNGPDPAESNAPNPSAPTDSALEESPAPHDEGASNGENGENPDNDASEGEEDDNEGNDDSEEPEEGDNVDEGEDDGGGEETPGEEGDDPPNDDNQGGNNDGGDNSGEAGGGGNGGEDDDDGEGAVPVPVPGAPVPGAPVPGAPGGAPPGSGPPAGGPPAGDGGGGAPPSNPPSDKPPPDNQPDDPEPTATEEPATSTEEAETSTSASCGSSPTLVPEDASVRRQEDLPKQDECPLPEDEWVIWARNPKDQASTSAIEAKMREVLGPDAYIYKAQAGNWIGFFRAPMQWSQANEIRALPDVGQVHISRPTNSLLEGPSDSGFNLVRQPVAEPSLRSITQPPDTIIPFLLGNYVYDDSAGEEIEVYIVDTGAKKDHIEFTEGYNIMQNARYLTVADFDGETREDDSQAPKDPNGNPDIGHGTCMLSRIGGHIYGVAKKITPIIARVPRKRWTGGGVPGEDYLVALRQVDEDMGEGKKAIVNISWLVPRREVGKWSFPHPEDDSVDNSDWYEQELYDVLVSIIKKGGYVFVGSGNTAAKEIDGWPARLGKPSLGDRHIPELTVVGAAGVKGDIWPGTNRDPEGLPHVYAPGYKNSRNPRDDMRCAMIAEDVQGDYRDTGMTSAATAMVSGLAAYFLKLSENPDLGIDVSTPQLMKEYMLKNAWGRESDDVKAIWNGVTEKDLPAGDDGNLDYCPIPRRLGEEPEPKPEYLKFPPSSNFPVPDDRQKRQEAEEEEEEEEVRDDIGMCKPDEGSDEEETDGDDSEGEDDGNGEDEEESGGDEGEGDEEPDEATPPPPEPTEPMLCKQWSCPLGRDSDSDDCECMDKRAVPMMFTA